MTTLLDLLAGAVLAGSVVGLMALGLSLTYRTTGVLNLSQAGLAALGGYVAYAASGKMPMIAAVALALVITATVSALIGWLVDLRLGHHSAVTAMVATLAAGIVLSQVIEQIWGALEFFPNVIGHQPVVWGNVTVERVDVWATAAAICLALLLTGFLRLTKWGLAMRAIADSSDGARSSGIPAPRVRAFGYAIAGALACVSGFFVATSIGVLSPDFMDLYMVAALIAAVIGGLGSLLGAFGGALLISLAQSLFGYYAPTLTFGSKVIILGTFKDTLILVLLMAVLLLMPRGLLGGHIGREV